MRLYNINEIFASIQGEGIWSGLPMIFIRFSGCNLSCAFCDTKYHTKINYKLTARQIVHCIASGMDDSIDNEHTAFKSDKICFTGGEPALQVDSELCSHLAEFGYSLYIETNGTVQELPEQINWVTVSPKEKWVRKWGDELKIIWTGQTANEIYEWYIKDTQFAFYLLQPEYSYLPIGNCNLDVHKERMDSLCKIINENPTLGLSVQLQKILEVK